MGLEQPEGPRPAFPHGPETLTRRQLLSAAVAAAALPAQQPLIVPVRRVMDSRAKCTPEQFHHFWWSIWPEAVRDFRNGGIALQVSDASGEIKRTAGGRPDFVGLARGVLNLVLTDHIPMNWDRGQALAGVTTLYESYHLCLIAISYAHGDQIPFLSVNTCVHEILHALLGDVFVSRGKWYRSGEREFRTDWYGTLLWFHDGAAVRKSAREYLGRLQSSAPR